MVQFHKSIMVSLSAQRMLLTEVLLLTSAMLVLHSLLDSQLKEYLAFLMDVGKERPHVLVC